MHDINWVDVLLFIGWCGVMALIYWIALRGR
ncbi:hypothetical protein PP304_gp134 [Gordonia phage Phendrix]|uniref:Uncharacterized protein n=1 Tax=Gordonia phage Phendrix TaxID=2593335 RepID=A0A514U1E6_9CAUD|nr:hypothetical protein PP304_gp003 [Gordonia phage Phendrix]YP_010649233.1 hypothetical protein PP304_gp134 [Gordonia phage Phendrix]QDK02551.1 hypothetical protein SEA_PHENDRIX_3 [Gordonia phage Phendrix]QDK02735.1 hypothetical protein SEA_PHENDRIX_219 [Gordonia phage Phendrix]